MIPLFESVVNFTDLRAILSIAIKHLRLMLLCLILGLTLGLAYITYKTPIYYARALVHVIDHAPLPVDAETVFRDSALNSVVAQLNSPHIRERTARALGITATAETIQDKYIKLQKIHITLERNLHVEIWPYDPSLSAVWTAQLVREYLDYREEKRFESREKIVRSFSEEMARIRQRIETLAETQESFTEKHNLDETKRLLSELSRVPVLLVAATEKLAFLETIREKLDDPALTVVEKLSLLASTRRRLDGLALGEMIALPQETGTAATPRASSIIVTPELITADEPWQLLDKERAKLQAQLTEMSEIYLPGHRRMQAAQEQLKRINQNLELELQRARRQFEIEYAASLSEKTGLERRFQERVALVKQDAALDRELNLLQTGQLSWENMYARVAKEMEAVDWGAERERIDLQYVGLIDLRHKPISPYRKKVFLYALVLGIALALAVPFILEYLDDTISFDEQVERILKINTIGIIPAIEKSAQHPETMNLLHGERHRQLTEYFRVIRVNLVSNVSFEGSRQVVMIASSLPKEGKSIMALNLAISFAKLGEKTLLIDADLRRGTLHRALGVSARPGLGQLLSDPTQPASFGIVPTPEPLLHILPSGRHIQSASELLESDRFRRLMLELRQDYTRIILDTPPVLGLAETAGMVKHADGVILVVWSGNTALKAVKTAKGMLDANGARYFGCVLNKLDLTNATTYYYYYYYSYKYYQNYHHENPDSRQRPTKPPVRT